MGRYDALLQDEVKTPAQPTGEQSSTGANEPAGTLAQPSPINSSASPRRNTDSTGNTGVRPSESPPARTPVRVKRTITRYAFEFFQDQIETLKAFSLDEQLRGEKGSMSQMVRQALDMYIAKRKRTE